ncbi:helix-turn-helix transcriptional regulator [Helicobacter muridarum]|uniref:Helix-turn-helix transcriptional regulator n=1 Tax=Helicobacter muridarum TaxID=216 RepID=A0A099TUT2_9HELI|nr:S24 family peptidase [Helicobacter muridarum]TLE01585.1 helix-turn-helix transcriptional regulator [Helicobacter muridarum]STQ86195.1 Uncharacterised protein [Helicobacter muridarum]
MSEESLCFIDTSAKDIKNGKIYAINTKDDVFVKQCYHTNSKITADSNLMLVSVNEAYAPMQYALDDIIVVGRVRGIINAL